MITMQKKEKHIFIELYVKKEERFHEINMKKKY